MSAPTSMYVLLSLFLPLHRSKWSCGGGGGGGGGMHFWHCFYCLTTDFRYQHNLMLEHSGSVQSKYTDKQKACI